MNQCTDFWCEHYGKESEKCDHCAKRENVNETPELRVILQRRAVNMMEIDKSSTKGHGQER